MSFETPYSISKDGIKFRDKLALKIKGELSLEARDEIAKSMNVAFQQGFLEGQATYAKMIQK